MADWLKWGNYAIKNDTHAICKALVNGIWIYSLYALPDTWLGNFPTAQAAKLALENNG